MDGRLVFAIALTAILLFGCTGNSVGETGNKTNEGTPQAEGTTLQRTIPENSSWQYVLFLPPDYNRSKSYPLIIGLHGTGGSAMDYVGIWKDEAARDNFILAFPQSPDTQGWDIRTVNAFVAAVADDVKANYNITNMYLTGHSAGARMIVTVALLNPRFRGVAMVDGALPPAYCPPDMEYCQSRYTLQYGFCTCAQGQYFYMINGGNDDIVTPFEATEAKSSLEKCGVNVTQRFLPNHAHEYPTEENENIAAWFISLENDRSIPNDSIICKSAGLCSVGLGKCGNYKLHADTAELDFEIEDDYEGTIFVKGVICTQNSSPTYASELMNEWTYDKNSIYYGGSSAYSVTMTNGSKTYIAKSDDAARPWLDIKCTDANGNLPADREAGASYNGTIYIIYSSSMVPSKYESISITEASIETTFES